MCKKNQKTKQINLVRLLSHCSSDSLSAVQFTSASHMIVVKKKRKKAGHRFPAASKTKRKEMLVNMWSLQPKRASRAEVDWITVGLFSPSFKKTPHQAGGISPLHRQLKATLSHNVAH